MKVLINALNTIYNNEVRGHKECVVYPISKLLLNVLNVMQKEGYIGEVEYIDDGRGGKLRVQLLGRINKCAAIYPRFYVKCSEIDEWAKIYLPARDVGTLILTTSKGVMTHHEAKKRRIGGALLAYVY